MPSENDGIMIILSSPSGAGKTTLVNLLKKLDNFEISISHTTRKPRPNEIPDKDYYFVTEDNFKRLIKNEEFLEYAKVFDNFYGSTRTPVIDKLNKGKNVLFDIDWQGADQIKNKNLDYKLITFFILPPSKKVLFDEPGKVVPRAEILEQLWGYPPRRAADLRVVDVYVARLRGKLEPDPRNPELILTVRGIGYASQRVGETATTLAS